MAHGLDQATDFTVTCIGISIRFSQSIKTVQGLLSGVLTNPASFPINETNPFLTFYHIRGPYGQCVASGVDSCGYSGAFLRELWFGGTYLSVPVIRILISA